MVVVEARDHLGHIAVERLGTLVAFDARRVFLVHRVPVQATKVSIEIVLPDRAPDLLEDLPALLD